MKIRKDKEKLAKAQNKEVAPAATTADATKTTTEPVDNSSVTEKLQKDKGGAWTKDGRSRWWSFIVYTDAVQGNWVDIINNEHLPWAMSPFHDKDINEDGTPKKPHFHVLIYYSNKAFYHEVIELVERVYLRWEAGQEQEVGFSEVGASRRPGKIEPVKSARGMLRYFAHMDNAEKYQYEPSDIKGFNGLDVDKYIQTMVDIDETIKEITQFIRQSHIDEYKDLIFYAIDHADEFPNWHKCVSTHTIHFRALLGSIRGAGSRYARPIVVAGEEVKTTRV